MISAPDKRITEVGIKPGTNLTIKIPSKADPTRSIDVFSSYEMTIDDYTFLVTAPMQGTVLYPISPGERVTVTYLTDSASFESGVIVGERLSKGDLNYLTLTCDGHVKRNQRRGDFRVDIIIETTTIQALRSNPSLMLPGAEQRKCIINNLSAGGAALLTDEAPDVGDPIHIDLPAMIFGLPKSLMAQVHWVRRVDDRDVPYKNYMGIRFIFNNTLDKEDLIKFTLEHQRKQLRKEKL